MKILYAIQGTGNGHISRAVEIIPHLMEKGEVSLLVSGTSSDLHLPYPVRYRLHGWSYVFGKHGGIDFVSTLKHTRLFQLFREIRQLPVHEYDLVISDFEPVSAWACLLRGKRCVGLSNQSVIKAGKLERPAVFDPIGQLILRYYAPTSVDYGFHFSNLGPGYYPPVIRKQVRELKVSDMGHYTVYLPAHDDDQILKFLRRFRQIRWQVFSKHNRIPLQYNNISIQPIDSEAFMKSLATCSGVLCAAGFATTSEALFLKKKLLVIPMKNQIEQHYNALALKNMGVAVIPSLATRYITHVSDWLSGGIPLPVSYEDQTAAMVDELIRLEFSKEDNYVRYLTKDQFQYLPS